MEFADFERSLSGDQPPSELLLPAQALWFDAKGEWDKAHGCVQGESGDDAAWVHAYLHRKEGDLPNAAYWYRRAGQPLAAGPLEQEWSGIASALVRRGAALT